MKKYKMILTAGDGAVFAVANTKLGLVRYYNESIPYGEEISRLTVKTIESGGWKVTEGIFNEIGEEIIKEPRLVKRTTKILTIRGGILGDQHIPCHGVGRYSQWRLHLKKDADDNWVIVGPPRMTACNRDGKKIEKKAEKSKEWIKKNFPLGLNW